MKRITLITAMMLLSCGTAFAQFSNAGSSGTKRLGSSSPVNTENYTSVYFQYNPSSFGDSKSFDGLTLGVSHAINIMEEQPLYIEVGGNVQYSSSSSAFVIQYISGSTIYREDKVSWKMLSVGVPMNLTYVWHVADKIAIAPYLGLNFRLNLWGKLDGRHNVFDSDQVGNSTQHNRFQMGWQIGANFQFNNTFFIGGGYGTDFMELFEDCKIGRASITAGFIF